MIYILLLILLFAAELAYFRIANHFNIIDKPNERSSHTRITLRGGGVIFYLSILVFFILNRFEYPWFFAGLTLISLISFADDIKPQSFKLRLLIHFTAIVLVFIQWQLFSQSWYLVILAIILCVGILNAYNFMDGINGITGGYSTVLAIGLWYINNYVVSFTDNQILYLLLLSLFVFNFFNFRKKAKCFAGDIGAVSLAFIFIFLVGQLILKTGNFSYIILFVVYGVDTVLTIVHRLILRENIFEAHRKHVYQLMANELKIPHLLVAGVYALLQGLILAGYLLFSNNDYWYFLTVIIALSVIYLILKLKYFRLHNPVEIIKK